MVRFYLRCLGYFRQDVLKIVATLLLIGLGSGCALLQAFPTAILFDSVIGDLRPPRFIYELFFMVAPESKAGQIVALAVATLALRLVQELCSMGQTFLNIRIGFNGLMRVRCDLFRKLQELSLAYHKSQPQGDAIYRLSWDTFGFQTILNVLVLTILVSGVTLAIMVAIMLSMDWRLTLLSLTVAPLLIWTTRVYSRILRRKTEEAKEFDTQLTTAIQRSVATIGLVQAFGREADEYAHFSRTVRQTASAYLRLHWQEMLYWLFVGTIFGAGTALVLGYGGWRVYQDQVQRGLAGAGMTIGSLSMFMWYLGGQLYGPLSKLVSAPAAIQNGAVGAHRVFEVLDRDPIIKDAPDAVSLPLKQRTLALENVSFEYRPGAAVLRDVSVSIAPGEMVAFVGSSGVGKTTLLNLLPRFYDPVAGAMKLDGIDARRIRIRDLRRHIALVLQESVVLPTSVAENIAYGRPDATDAQIQEAARLAGADVFIRELENGYDTLVSEQGANLSGGQKQRISIARALLTEAPIVVMDEPTSALDPHHEQQIIETLRRLKGLRTFVLVSHRLSTVADCDRIFVMHEGRVVEQGTHGQLLSLRGRYWEMARRQLRLEDVETPQEKTT